MSPAVGAEKPKRAPALLVRELGTELRSVQRYVASLPSVEGVSIFEDAIVLAEAFLRASVSAGERRYVLSRYVNEAWVAEMLAVLKRLRSADPVSTAFVEAGASVVSWIDNEIRQMRQTLPHNVVSVIGTLLDRFESRVAVQRGLYQVQQQRAEVEEVAREAAESASSAREIVGEAAASELSADFAAYAAAEARRSARWSATAIAALVSVAVFSALVMLKTPGETLLDRLGRLTVSIPVAAIAVYAARVAGHHRLTARWAHTNAVQLKTIRAYSDLLSEESRDKLRLAFGTRVFSWETTDDGDHHPSPGVINPADLLAPSSELLKGAAEIVKATRP